MSASQSVRNDEEVFVFPDLSRLVKSRSFHSTVEGKIWVRLLINLCWWLHDMYEVKGTDPNSKFNYIEDKLANCPLFPAQFLLIFSDLKVLPKEQHPFLICRQDEHKTIILVFRATVSSKSIHDVFTDISFYANRAVYEGNRHAGFSKRAESGPLLAVINWLQQGWKVIITGHSLGGAVSQLFTCAVIQSLAETGKTPADVVLRCVTFGIPQCADYSFWSSYTDWYDVFDTYIYENDAIFRLATFGTDKAKDIIESFGSLGKKLIEYMIDDQQLNVPNSVGDQIVNIIKDATIPAYAVFGRHHFIVKNQTAALEIKSIGESNDEKDRLLKDLKEEKSWYNYLIEKKLIPSGSFTFVYREFCNHGCYPFAINQLFNQEANQRLRNLRTQKSVLLRSPLENGDSKSRCNISATVYSPNEIHPNPDFIYLKGFLVDFIRFVTLPTQLAESDESRKKTPGITQESDGRAVSCFKSTQSIEYIKRHSTFSIHVTTFFGSCNVLVGVLSNSTNRFPREVYQLDPISTILRAYHELVLDASSAEQYNDSSLSRCFSMFFDAFELVQISTLSDLEYSLDALQIIGDLPYWHDHAQKKFDRNLARYFAEMHSSNYLDDPIKYLQNLKMPKSEGAINSYYEKELAALKKTSEDKGHGSDETRRTAEHLYKILSNTINSSNNGIQLTPLYLEFNLLRQYLHDLHTHQDRDIDVIKKTLKAIMAPYFFIQIKLNRLMVLVDIGFFNAFFLLSNNPYLTLVVLNQIVTGGKFWQVRKTLTEIASSLLSSSGENLTENEDEWHILTRIKGCRWSQEITQAKSVQELDAIWDRTFTSAPLKNVPRGKNRLIWFGLIRLYPILCSMRQILIEKPPKVVISGRSQTGKSTLFKYLTGRNLEELRNIDAFNTRMSLQCPAFIKFNSDSDDESGLQIDVVDNPGQDDATGQAKNLLNMSLDSASLFILVTTLTDVNQQHTIELLDRVLKDTRINILVLINRIDDRLLEAWETFKNQSSNNDKPVSDGWGNTKRKNEKQSVSHTTIGSTTPFSAFDTVERLITRPKIELKKGLTTDRTEIDNRVTIKPVILKDFDEEDPIFVKLSEFAIGEERFFPQVRKSNINTWIIENLTGSTT